MVLYSHPYQRVETNAHIALKTLRVICGIRCALRYTYVLSHKFELYFLALCGCEKKDANVVRRKGRRRKEGRGCF